MCAPHCAYFPCVSLLTAHRCRRMDRDKPGSSPRGGGAWANPSNYIPRSGIIILLVLAAYDIATQMTIPGTEAQIDVNGDVIFVLEVDRLHQTLLPMLPPGVEPPRLAGVRNVVNETYYELNEEYQ
jgi:hypothetical protein